MTVPILTLFVFDIHSIRMAQAFLFIIFPSNADARGSSFSSTRGRVVSHSSDVGSLDVHDVDVRFEEGFDGSLSGVETDGDGSEDTGYYYPITGLDEIDKLVVGTE